MTYKLKKSGKKPKMLKRNLKWLSYKKKYDLDFKTKKYCITQLQIKHQK
jgi:hypothetical protein